MGKPIQRLGDKNSGGGVVTKGDPTVLVDGIPICVTGSPVSPHQSYPTHVGVVTIASQSSVFCNGRPVVTMGDADSCGDTRVGGSSTVSIG